MIDITTVTGPGCVEFRDYILQNPNTLVYAEPRFLSLISEHLDARCAWLVARRQGVITGLLPFLVKDGPLGPVYNSLAYYGSNGGVIQINQDVNSKTALCEAFYASSEDEKAASATIISNPLEDDCSFYDTLVEYDSRDERIGLITHFLSTKEDLIYRLSDPRPRNIRRAIKEGVVVIRNNAEALDFVFKTHVENMAAIGGIAKKRTFFDAISSKMHSDDWSVFTALLDGEPIAALLVLYFNRTVEYFTPVIIEEYRKTQALSLVIYESMRDAIQRGYKNWNWGGTWIDQNGVYDFKKRWGTSEYRYFYYTRIMNNKLKLCTSTYLLDHYPGFYLLPFNRLIR